MSLRYSLAYRDLAEIMAERGLSVDHVTIWRWVQRYGPVLNQRIRRDILRPNRVRARSRKLGQGRRQLGIPVSGRGILRQGWAVFLCNSILSFGFASAVVCH